AADQGVRDAEVGGDAGGERAVGDPGAGVHGAGGGGDVGAATLRFPLPWRERVRVRGNRRSGSCRRRSPADSAVGALAHRGAPLGATRKKPSPPLRRRRVRGKNWML